MSVADFRNQRGSGFIEVLLVLVVVGAIAFIGFRILETHQNATSGINTQAAVPAKIASTGDLQQAASALNTTNVSGIDLTEVNQDLNSLL